MSSAGLRISAEIAAGIVAHARAELPNEACGLLAGDVATGRATAYHPARNAHASPLRFDLHPEDLVRIVFEIESAGDELLGVFHSHPRSAAVPSAADLRDARYDVVHLIATLSEPRAPPLTALRAWRFVGGTPVAVPILVTARAPDGGRSPSALG